MTLSLRFPATGCHWVLSATHITIAKMQNKMPGVAHLGEDAMGVVPLCPPEQLRRRWRPSIVSISC